MFDTSAESGFFYADSLPKRNAKYFLNFRMNDGEVYLTKGLYDLLNIGGATLRVALFKHKGSFYIFQTSAKNALLIRELKDPKFGVTGAAMCSRQLCDGLRKVWTCGSKDVVKVPVMTFCVSAVELGLDPRDYPSPFYRLDMDSKTIKSV
jgi:hypothetical protein